VKEIPVRMRWTRMLRWIRKAQSGLFRSELSTSPSQDTADYLTRANSAFI
jgi:hypothetical protein